MCQWCIQHGGWGCLRWEAERVVSVVYSVHGGWGCLRWEAEGVVSVVYSAWGLGVFKVGGRRGCVSGVFSMGVGEGGRAEEGMSQGRRVCPSDGLNTQEANNQPMKYCNTEGVGGGGGRGG